MLLRLLVGTIIIQVNKFSTAPPGNGAYLIKNSWNPSYFGISGYFWISYYDSVFASQDPPVAYSGVEATTNYDRQYAYDPLGWSYSISDTNKSTPANTGWYGIVFTAKDNETLKAVATYVYSNASPYVVKVYTGVTDVPTGGTLAASATTSGTVSIAGYNTVVLTNSVPLTKGLSIRWLCS